MNGEEGWKEGRVSRRRKIRKRRTFRNHKSRNPTVDLLLLVFCCQKRMKKRMKRMNPSSCFDCSLVCSICYSVCFSARLTASIHAILSTVFSLSLHPRSRFVSGFVCDLHLFISLLVKPLFISLWIFCFLLIREASDWNNCPDQESLLLLM